MLSKSRFKVMNETRAQHNFFYLAKKMLITFSDQHFLFLDSQKILSNADIIQATPDPPIHPEYAVLIRLPILPLLPRRYRCR